MILLLFIIPFLQCTNILGVGAVARLFQIASKLTNRSADANGHYGFCFVHLISFVWNDDNPFNGFTSIGWFCNCPLSKLFETEIIPFESNVRVHCTLYRVIRPNSCYTKISKKKYLLKWRMCNILFPNFCRISSYLPLPSLSVCSHTANVCNKIWIRIELNFISIGLNWIDVYLF